jgi:hypothetical protein
VELSRLEIRLAQTQLLEDAVSLGFHSGPGAGHVA